MRVSTYRRGATAVAVLHSARWLTASLLLRDEIGVFGLPLSASFGLSFADTITPW